MGAAPNEQWAMGFVHDTLADGRSFRAFTVVDICTRECVAIEVETSLSGVRVVRVLEQLQGRTPHQMAEQMQEATTTRLSA